MIIKKHTQTLDALHTEAGAPNTNIHYLPCLLSNYPLPICCFREQNFSYLQVPNPKRV